MFLPSSPCILVRSYAADLSATDRLPKFESSHEHDDNSFELRLSSYSRHVQLCATLIQLYSIFAETGPVDIALNERVTSSTTAPQNRRVWQPRSFCFDMAAFFLLLNLVLSTLASPLLRHELGDGPSQLRRRQNPTVAVTGITDFGVQPRLEIRQLEQNTDQWNIFLLGLARFQQTDQSNLTSYYQIAGIHGRPFIPWDDVPPADGVNSPGYCMHVLNLFLSWHRPFLALFEQSLFEHMVDAVNEFPRGAQRQRYASAALSWRFPFWDWAAAPPAGESVWPVSLQLPTVDVTMPNGTNTIPNPLYSYQFHPVSASDFYYSPVSIV